MVGFLKKLERTDVPFLQAAEILYGQGGEVHVHPANAAAILFRTVNRVNEFQYIINTASGHDNARVRHGKAQYGDKLEKILIVQGVRRPGGQIRPDGRFDAAR